MANRKVVIAVDENFFNNIFEQKRKELQKQLGLMNLSQANFTKMIKGLKLNIPKKSLLNTKLKGIKKYDKFKI